MLGERSSPRPNTQFLTLSDGFLSVRFPLAAWGACPVRAAAWDPGPVGLWFSIADSTAQPSAAKFCGGFRPNFGIVWKQKESVVAVAMICFTWHEVLLVYRAKSIICDPTEKGFMQLRELLLKYRDQRPKFRAYDEEMTGPPPSFTFPKPSADPIPTSDIKPRPPGK